MRKQHLYALGLVFLTILATGPIGQNFRRANDARMEKMRGVRITKPSGDSVTTQGVFLENYALDNKASR